MLMVWRISNILNKSASHHADGWKSQKFPRNPLLPMLMVGNLKNSQEIRCSPCWWFDDFQKFSRNPLPPMLMVWRISKTLKKSAALHADAFQKILRLRRPAILTKYKKFARKPCWWISKILKKSASFLANGWEICCCPCFFKNSPPAAGYDLGKCLFWSWSLWGKKFLLWGKKSADFRWGRFCNYDK